MVRTAEYLENSARPAHDPAADHQNVARRPLDGKACSRQRAAPSRVVSSGPSGNTQVAVGTPKTGAMFNATTAQNPACGLATRQPMRQARNCDRANSRMNGRRTASGASVPKTWAAPQDSNQLAGGWSK